MRDCLLIVPLILPLLDLRSERLSSSSERRLFHDTATLEVVDHGHPIRLLSNAARERLEDLRQTAGLHFVDRHAPHIVNRVRLVAARALALLVAICAPVAAQRFAEWHGQRSRGHQLTEEGLGPDRGVGQRDLDFARVNGLVLIQALDRALRRITWDARLAVALVLVGAHDEAGFRGIGAVIAVWCR